MTDTVPRWNNLFDDLEAQLEHQLDAEEVDLRVEEERLRLARLSLRDRLVALKHAGSSVALLLDGPTTFGVAIATIGKDWIAGSVVDETGRDSQCLIPLGAIAGIELDADEVPSSLLQDEPAPAALTARLGIAFVLRDLCRRRAALTLLLRHGQVHGTIDRVGSDHFDLAVHDPDSPRRRTAVKGIRVIPLSQLLAVRI